VPICVEHFLRLLSRDAPGLVEFGRRGQNRTEPLSDCETATAIADLVTRVRLGELEASVTARHMALDVSAYLVNAVETVLTSGNGYENPRRKTLSPQYIHICTYTAVADKPLLSIVTRSIQT